MSGNQREPRNVSMASIVEDQRLQMRVGGLNEVRIAEYRELLAEAKGIWPFPPITMVHGFLCDGWHRVEAARREGRKEVPAIVTRCDDIGDAFNEALRQASGANADHGLPRSNADKRRAVTALVETFPGLADREIARLAKVSHTFVGSMRATGKHELEDTIERLKMSFSAVLEAMSDLEELGILHSHKATEQYARDINATISQRMIELAELTP